MIQAVNTVVGSQLIDWMFPTPEAPGLNPVITQPIQLNIYKLVNVNKIQTSQRRGQKWFILQLGSAPTTSSTSVELIQQHWPHKSNNSKAQR